MDYVLRQFSQEEADFLDIALELKERYLQAQGIAHLPPIFDVGDNAGFFFGTKPDDHTTGVITAEGPQDVTVLTPAGQEFKVSPFLIFRLQ